MKGNAGIQFKNVSKNFPGVRALDNVSFEITAGDIHALVGENGAGKSTLLNILHGVYSGYEGEILIDGERINFKNAHEAITSGILKVHQEVNVIPGLTVGQNIALGYEPESGLLINFKKMNSDADQILQSMGCKFRSSDLASTLSAGEFQMLSIAKALFHKARIISFDEPTAALTNREADMLFNIIRDLKKNGITIIYVSHRLDEIFQIADRTTVLRDGKYIGTYNVAEITRERLIKSMVGRDVSAFASRNKLNLVADEVVLEVKNLSCNNAFQNISFTLKKGELLGFAGLVGSKRTDVMRTIFGADLKSGGEIYIRGKKVNINSPQSALRHGIGLIPENRKMQGFVRLLTNSDNIGLASLPKFSWMGFLNHHKKIKNCEHFIKRIHIHPPDPLCSTENLSGGNQQKVILAKWLSTEVDIFIFDEPTKGVDVGAKWDIYCLLEDLLEAGKSIIMVSSELPEIIGMSDRVMVMHEGKLVKELSRSELSEEKILYYAMEGK